MQYSKKDLGELSRPMRAFMGRAIIGREPTVEQYIIGTVTQVAIPPLHDWRILMRYSLGANTKDSHQGEENTLRPG